MAGGADALEWNFDGLVGPTHNYSALAHGNRASERYGGDVSHPREAALQALAKAKAVADLGVPQAVLPPQPRPELAVLRRLGFRGAPEALLRQAAREAPELLASAYSASAMWVANAASVSPSADTADGRVHFTPANLVSHFHRSLEAPSTQGALRRIFRGPAFRHHAPLPAATQLGDEGAANQLRLCSAHGEPGLEVFVYGWRAFAAPRPAAVPSGAASGSSRGPAPQKYAPRQALEASRAVARLHRLRPERALFLQQAPDAIDEGVFHNDVACVSLRNVLLLHERAFADQPTALDGLRRAFERECGGELVAVEVPERRLPLADAVTSYLFNSQLLERADGSLLLLCPAECEANPRAREALEWIAASPANPIAAFRFANVRESMKNGGGPACLRLRVVLSEAQAQAVGALRLTDELFARLQAWIGRHYREKLDAADLADPALLRESAAALAELDALLFGGAR